MNPIVSIIVPVYKVEKYLNRCVDSILNQSFTDFELILVDDESPDYCGAICDNYRLKDRRVRVIHKQNGGLSSARNAGIKQAIGDYICFVDSDDWLDNQYVESLYRMIVHYDADMTACRFCESIEGQKTPQNRTSWNIQVFSDNLMFHAITEKTFSGFACNKLFKACYIKEHGLLFDEKIFNGEDLPFVIEYLKHCKNVAYTDSELYYYNIRPQSITTTRSFSERAYTILYAREKVLETLKEFAPDCVDIELAAYISHLIKMKYLVVPIRRDFPNHYLEVKSKLKRVRPRILFLKGVSTKSKIKLFIMVYFSRVCGKMYRKNKL